LTGLVVRERAESPRESFVLPREFYSRETVEVAEDLLGKILVRRLRKSVILEGRIVEVEAYRGRDDPASHAYRGPTKRNEVMFDRVGLAYVYFIYGNHYCLNITARDASEQAGAVLLRALQPLGGIGRMLKNRDLRKETLLAGRQRTEQPSPNVANGPGKLTQAMGITGKLNGIDVTDRMSELNVRGDAEDATDVEIVSAQRIGIARGKDKAWRFFVKDNAFVSKP
jgi:DNA-3-methyladenine glycosylase